MTKTPQEKKIHTAVVAPLRAASKVAETAGTPLHPYSPPSNQNNYDFIIVGGGTAGCVLANRLSADPTKRVLLLEAGPDAAGDRTIRTPSGLARLFKSRFDWNLYATPNAQVDERSIYMARGFVMGGSSCTNATLYHRGAARDYDAWGIPGWTSQELAPWFEAAECNSSKGDVPGLHSTKGLMNVEDPRYRSKLHDAFFEAAAQRGLKANDDFNDWSRSQLGYGEFQVSQRRGERAAAATTYLTEEVRARENLTIVANARALKVEVGDDSRSNSGPFSGAKAKAAKGVIYAEGNTPDARVVEALLRDPGEGGTWFLRGRRRRQKKKKRETLSTTKTKTKKTHSSSSSSSFFKKTSTLSLSFSQQKQKKYIGTSEVIMAAGAVHTPHVLMLSGLGDASALRDAGVKPEVSLPGLGKNLQDHPACLSAFTLKASAGAISITDHLLTRSGRLRAGAVLNYALRRRGPLTSTGCDHGAFVSTGARSADNDLGPDVADLQVRLAPGLALNPDGIGSYVEFGRLAAEGRKWPSGLTFQLLAVRPRSHGSISLRSSSPWDAPLFDPAFLSDDKGLDAATLRGGLRLSRELASAPALEKLLEEEMHPGAAATTDDELDAYVRLTLHSGNAVVGSARMGSNGSGTSDAVVDPATLRVHGVTGLRIADASVLPAIPGGQTGAAVVVVAERAAALLGARSGLGVRRGGGESGAAVSSSSPSYAPA